MPTNRTRMKRGAVSKLSGSTERHLLCGCCLVFACDICFGGPGMARPLGKEAYELRPEAERIWTVHRSRLLASWRDPDAMPTGAGFSAAGLRGAGRWIPCFAEVVFDGMKLPKRSAAWPSVVKKLHEEMSDNLKR